MDKLSEQLTASIDKNRLKDILCREAKVEKVGGIALLYYDTLSKINIYKYAGNSVWFDGRSYVVVEKEKLENSIFISMRYLGISDGILNKEFPSMCKTVWRNLGRNDFVLNKRRLCFTNCVLNVDTMEVCDFSPEHMVVNRIEFDYNPNATCPKWLSFLGEVLPDKSVVAALQDFLSLLLVDRSLLKIEHMAILLGTGSNGKSVVFEIVKALVGKSITTFELGELTSSASTREYKIAAIEGKMINYCSELSKNELSGGKIKGLVSGEPMMARDPYGKNFMANNIPLMMCNANELPATSDYSKGYFRRWLIIAFNVYIEADKQNKFLHTELITELSGIFNWIIEGLRRMEKNKFIITESESVKDEVTKYEMNSNSVLKFLEEKEYYHIPVYKDHLQQSILASAIYSEYKTYCYDFGYGAFSNIKFAEKLKDKGFQKKRTGDGIVYTFYRMPLEEAWDALVAQGKVTTSREEYMRTVKYMRMGEKPTPQIKPVQMRMEEMDDLPPI